MDQFEYVMVLVSIVIALSIAHLLTALAAGIHRFRGKGEPIKLDAVFLLWIGFVLIYLVSFWWWEFTFQKIQIKWSYGLYLFVIGYSIILFMLSADWRPLAAAIGLAAILAMLITISNRNRWREESVNEEPCHPLGDGWQP